jgi:methylglyoxal reductase
MRPFDANSCHAITIKGEQMQYRALGNSGIDASAIVLGAWAIGGGSVWGNETVDQNSIDTIRAAVDAGINIIDTAPAYGFGHSEEVVGQAIQGIRDKVLIATKCGLWWEDGRGAFHCPYDGKELRVCLEPETIRIEVENSLRRLNVDVIDLYQVHFASLPGYENPVADTMACLVDLKDQGKIRSIGVSNVSMEQFPEYLAGGPIATNQPRYSIINRQIEDDILPFTRENNIATLAYMPLEQGLLTGKVTMETVYKEGDFRNHEMNFWFKPVNRQKVLDMLAGWSNLTEKYDCTLAQLTIAWTIAQPGLTHAICGARKVEQIVDTARAADLELAEEDIARMRSEAESIGEPE